MSNKKGGLLAAGIKALAFDVFGTVVDWRAGVIGECEELKRRHAIEIDAARFADAWRSGYAPALDQVRKGELPWTKVDVLHRMILDSLLSQFAITCLTEAEKQHLNRVWHRLSPWQDTVAGLSRLKRRFIIATLSNADVALLASMAKHSGLPWDCIFSAELFHHYKPDPEVYRGAAELLAISLDELMMVAAHQYDLKAAKALGCKTAYIRRPLEFGPGKAEQLAPDAKFDVIADSIEHLAQQLGA